MSTITQRAEGAKAHPIPAHPVWCTEHGKTATEAHGPAAGFEHRGDTVHAELQSFEVGVSVGLAQYDEPHSFDSGRCVTEPQLEVIVNYRAGMQRIEFGATLAEAKALAGVLQEGIHQLGMVHEAASTPDARASWALGWTPETLR